MPAWVTALRDKAVEIVVGALLVAVLWVGWGVRDEVRDLNSQFKVFDVDHGNTKRRVDAMAQALPDLRVKVAQEYIQRPVLSALLMTEPTQSQGSWSVDALFVDVASQSITKFRKALTGGSDQTHAWALIGGMQAVDPGVVTIKNMEDFSRDTSIKVRTVPSGFAKDYSFVSQRGIAPFGNHMKLLGFQAVEVKKFALPKDMVKATMSWSDFSTLVMPAVEGSK